MICDKEYVEEVSKKINIGPKDDKLSLLYKWLNTDTAWIADMTIRFYNSANFFIRIYKDGSGLLNMYDNNFDPHDFSYFKLDDDTLKEVYGRIEKNPAEFLPLKDFKNIDIKAGDAKFQIFESIKSGKDEKTVCFYNARVHGELIPVSNIDLSSMVTDLIINSEEFKDIIIRHNNTSYFEALGVSFPKELPIDTSVAYQGPAEDPEDELGDMIDLFT